MEGLIDTAVETILVLGWEDAKGQVQSIAEAVTALELFWGDEFSEVDWEEKIAEAIENVKRP